MGSNSYMARQGRIRRIDENLDGSRASANVARRAETLAWAERGGGNATQGPLSGAPVGYATKPDGALRQGGRAAFDNGQNYGPPTEDQWRTRQAEQQRAREEAAKKRDAWQNREGTEADNSMFGGTQGYYVNGIRYPGARPADAGAVGRFPETPAPAVAPARAVPVAKAEPAVAPAAPAAKVAAPLTPLDRLRADYAAAGIDFDRDVLPDMERARQENPDVKYTQDLLFGAEPMSVVTGEVTANIPGTGAASSGVFDRQTRVATISPGAPDYMPGHEVRHGMENPDRASELYEPLVKTSVIGHVARWFTQDESPSIDYLSRPAELSASLGGWRKYGKDPATALGAMGLTEPGTVDARSLRALPPESRQFAKGYRKLGVKDQRNIYNHMMRQARGLF